MGGTAAVFISVLDVIPKSLAIKLAELKIRVYRIWLRSFVFGTVGPDGLFLNCAPFCSVMGNRPGEHPRNCTQVHRNICTDVRSRSSAQPFMQSPQWTASIRFMSLTSFGDSDCSIRGGFLSDELRELEKLGFLPHYHGQFTQNKWLLPEHFQSYLHTHIFPLPCAYNSTYVPPSSEGTSFDVCLEIVCNLKMRNWYKHEVVSSHPSLAIHPTYAGH